MSGYANIKPRKFRRGILKWLENSKGVDILTGTKHVIKVLCIHNGEVYPIPISHRDINKHIIKNFMEFLVKYDICTKEEFDARLH